MAPEQKVERLASKRYLLVLCLMLFAAFSLTACSSGPSIGSSTGDDFSIAEYNADVDNLALILDEAKSLDHQIENMGDPNQFTTQNQVDQYNNLVDRYNDAADRYTRAAKAFNSKYSKNIDGSGTRPTDPDNIKLPSKM